MRGPRRLGVRAFMKATDLVFVVAAYAIVSGALHPLDPSSFVTVFSMLVSVGDAIRFVLQIVFWHALLVTAGLYDSDRFAHWTREWQDLAAAAGIAVAASVVLSGPIETLLARPHFPILLFSTAFALLGGSRAVLGVLARRLRRHGRNLRNVLVVAEGSRARELAAFVRARPELGYTVLQSIVPEERSATDEASLVGAVTTAIDAAPLDEVFLALPSERYARPVVDRIVGVCSELGITVRVFTEWYKRHAPLPATVQFDGQPVLTIASHREDPVALGVKRFLDVVIAVVLLVGASPVLAAAAIAIRLDSPGPVLFRQMRVGLNRRMFRMLKFRTMVVDAESRQADLESRNEVSGPVFKIRDDPRVTRVGRWLRRTSIDELPQLINVLRGDMSLVGPRPLPVRDVQLMERRGDRRRFSVRPGLTCLWQVNGRSAVVDFDQWVRMDLDYIDNWSLVLDLQILAKTVPAVLRGAGAY